MEGNNSMTCNWEDIVLFLFHLRALSLALLPTNKDTIRCGAKVPGHHEEKLMYVFMFVKTYHFVSTTYP